MHDDTRTKLLWHSNAPWAPTGYGNQTGLFLPELSEHYDVACSSFYGLEGKRINWKGIPVYPGLGGEFGNGSLLQHARHFFDGDPRGGITISLMDVFVIQVALAQQLDMACITPIDHDPAPPNVVEFLRLSGVTPIAMSRFGQERLAALGALYIPHMIDTDVFRPHDQAECRRQLGWDEDEFCVGIVAANKGRPSRKGFFQALSAFAAFQREHENARLYLHTELDPNHGQGEDLVAMLEYLRVPADAVRIASSYSIQFDPMPPEIMAMMYSSLDVLLNPAMGEGFGITVMEAQACGVPGIVTNFSAMPEVCGAGWHVGWRPFYTAQNSMQATANQEEILLALEECIALKPQDRAALSAKARQHALDNYAIPVVMEQHALPVIRELEERFAARKPAPLAGAVVA